VVRFRRKRFAFFPFTPRKVFHKLLISFWALARTNRIQRDSIKLRIEAGLAGVIQNEGDRIQYFHGSQAPVFGRIVRSVSYCA
jgi:hypothetical protein